MYEHDSRFLRVPLEIRHHIYRYLLLDPPESYLSTPWFQEGDQEKVQDVPTSIWKHHVGWKKKDGKEKEDEEEEEQEDEQEVEVDVRRFPAILCTNRQIYNEASYLFYSELEVHIQPGDVLCMNTGKDIVKASERLWRHNPLNGTGTTNSSGFTDYAKPELEGVLEPHDWPDSNELPSN